MDKFDRVTQNKLLKVLSESHPRTFSKKYAAEFQNDFGGVDNFISNLIYLSGHNLIDVEIGLSLDGKVFIKKPPIITHDGIDFIRDDGGLGAILKVVNIRLHDDSIKMLEDAINSSDATEQEKASVVSTLRKLPEDAIKHLNLKLLDMGLSHLPNAVHAIQTALHNLF